MFLSLFLVIVSVLQKKFDHQLNRFSLGTCGTDVLEGPVKRGEDLGIKSIWGYV